MFIQNEQTKNTKAVMDKIRKDKEEETRIRREEVLVSKHLLELNRMAPSIQRTKDKKKIQRFNEDFFKTIRRLTDLRRQIGKDIGKEVTRMINEWKKTH